MIEEISMISILRITCRRERTCKETIINMKDRRILRKKNQQNLRISMNHLIIDKFRINIRNKKLTIQLIGLQIGKTSHLIGLQKRKIIRE
jgi:hypothetical protein